MSSQQRKQSSFAILGLLAIQPWATYDLAKLMRRSLVFFWPRAESNLYAEPKRLVDAGLAEAHEEWNGDRRRTVYSITKAGRKALRDWLGDEPASARLESEPHLRLLYANHGSIADLLRTLDRLEADATSAIEHYSALCEEYARGDGLFPDRIHVNALLASLSIDQARATVDWVCWARAEVGTWSTTSKPDVEWAAAAMRRAIERGRPSASAP